MATRNERARRKRRRRSPPPLSLVRDVRPEPASPAQVARRFRRLLEEGARLCIAGTARGRPALLLARRYLPRSEIRLFDASYFLADYRFDDAVGFFVGYVVLGENCGKRVEAIWPRVFYKDASLLWRVASHFVKDGDSVWIGKGDTRVEERGEWEYRHSVEETTNLPYELQFALDELSRRKRRRRDDAAIALIVREAPQGRIEPYADFTAPRRRAARAHAENGARTVARFARKGDPSSLSFARGYEPDFARGIVEESTSESAFFGGRIDKVRILSTNRRVQYLFFASPTHAWVAPPQLLSTELSTYGVRVHDVAADEDAFVPGYEYHDEDGSQIPDGFAGAPHPEHPDRADASAWLEALPMIRDFRAARLRRRRARG